jgi:ribonuclease P protein component
MKQYTKLRFNYEFARVYRKGRRVSGRVLTMHYLRRPNRGLRTGVTVSRRLKGAVKRNRFKRLIRESFRLLKPDLESGYDIIIMGRADSSIPDYETVRQDMIRLFKRVGISCAETQNRCEEE